ncbi:MAG TPA: helix-turn-helix domain-containing protein [Solirubrobacterales bacterium]|nr:helix-turn-helix domain-containing protein [Solirubrobacterales bacterium]
MRAKPSTRGPTVIGRERFTRARSAPTRAAILQILAIDDRRALSPAEIALELQGAIDGAGYHARVLEILGLVEVVGTRLDEGAQERFYRLADRRPDGLTPSTE